MPLPDRPVANTTIDSDWGQQVHDWTFAPTGADLTSAMTTTVGATVGGLHLELADEDPAGFLDAGGARAEVPTDKAGLYLVILSINAVNGDVGTETRGHIFLNGSSYSSTTVSNEGGTNVTITIVTFIPLTAGDEIRPYAQRRGSGTNPTVSVNFLRLLRLGNEYGA